MSSLTTGVGDAGDIGITTAGRTFIGHGAEVLVSSSGPGDAGDIGITSGSLTVQDASLSSAADVAAGGRIGIAATGTVDLFDARITTAVNGRANLDDAGDISIARPTFVILDGSRISANAVIGNSGNVRISSQQLIASPDSEVTATTVLGIDGTIVIDSPTTGIDADATALEGDYLDAAGLLRASCGEGGVSEVSTFTRTGRGGLPLAPHEVMGLPGSASAEAQPAEQAAATPPLRAARRRVPASIQTGLPCSGGT